MDIVRHKCEKELCRSVVILCLSLLVLICGCLISCSPHSDSNEKAYSVRGVVKEVGEKSVTVQHERIPGYMEAMTMPFDVKNTNELRGLQAGDKISFRMIVTSKEGWIEHITKLGHAEEMPSRSNIQVAKAIAPIEVGQPVPDFHLTNELGQPISLTGLRGKAVAITFFFTRCPYPNFCPRMNNNFAEAQKKIERQQNGPTNWMLLSVSFDPANDTPETLHQYAKVEQYDPNHWHFLTGSDAEITQLAEAFDEKYWHESGTISHNLRTAVIDAQGRLQKLFDGNQWTVDDLTNQIVTACKPAH
jgi:protein SCO1/2